MQFVGLVVAVVAFAVFAFGALASTLRNEGRFNDGAQHRRCQEMQERLHSK